MVEYAHELNKNYKKDPRLTIVSNLTMMNETIANWLTDHDVTICTSLDGPKHIHDKNRFILVREGKEVGTHDLVVSWIRRINQLYKEKKKPFIVNALMTVTKYSLPYHKEIIDEYVGLGISLVDVRALTMVGNVYNKEAKDYLYTKEEFIDFYNASIKYIDELKEKGVKIDDRMRKLYDTKIFENTPTYHIVTGILRGPMDHLLLQAYLEHYAWRRTSQVSS